MGVRRCHEAHRLNEGSGESDQTTPPWWSCIFGQRLYKCVEMEIWAPRNLELTFAGFVKLSPFFLLPAIFSTESSRAVSFVCLWFQR